MGQFGVLLVQKRNSRQILLNFLAPRPMRGKMSIPEFSRRWDVDILTKI
jgi:hypothetical protein